MKREVWFAIVCFLGYAWAADRFCKSCLEITKKKEILFVLLLWGGCLAAQAILPAAFPMLVQVILPVVLTILLFQGVWEKKILAASVVLTVITLAGNFCGSSMCCLLLVWLHMVKGIQEPFLTGGMSSAAECVSFAIVIALLCGMAESSTDVFAGKDRRWYITMAIPLLILTAVMSLVNWGVGNGVLVRGCFLLEVKNSTDTAKIQGIKTKEKGHGIGLLNIGDMVKRYQGVMNREEGEEIYTISILLPFEKGGDDSVGKKKGKGGLL